jgi:hypothetical protein
MRKPALSAWKRLGKRMDRVASFRDALRIGGVLVRSPYLVDGSIEVDNGSERFVLSSEQIARLQERLPNEIRGPATALPVHPDRIAMSEDDLAEYIVFIERRIAMQRHSTYPRGE